MPVKQPKKLLIMNILDILRKYSDEEHRLSQKDIAEILKTEYDMTADRKAIRRNILNLMDCGYNIEFSESIRMVPNPKTGQPEESYLWSDFYLERDFTDGELRLLIDSLLFSKHIPYSQCKELVGKLEGLSNVYFRSRVKRIARLPEDKTDNKQLFLTIELLDEAISRGRKVSFKYLEYGTDKRQHSKTRPDGTERVYIISPYQMAAKEGKYYLICNYDKYDDISNYRLDRITELKILDAPAKPFEHLKWANGRTLALAANMKGHPYMCARDKGRADDLELMERVEELGIRKIMTRKHQSIPMCANVDLYSGLIYSMLDIPEDMYTPLFATARIAGWCAHRLEELATGNRIMRPAYRAMLMKVPYIPVEARE